MEERNHEYVPTNRREESELLLCREVALERDVGCLWGKVSPRLKFSDSQNSALRFRL